MSSNKIKIKLSEINCSFPPKYVAQKLQFFRVLCNIITWASFLNPFFFKDWGGGASGGGRGRGRGRISSRFLALSWAWVRARHREWSLDPDFQTWAENKSHMLNRLHHPAPPATPFLNSFEQPIKLLLGSQALSSLTLFWKWQSQAPTPNSFWLSQ